MQDIAAGGAPVDATGHAARDLPDDELIQLLAAVHRARHEVFRHGPDQALVHHDARTAELETEYLRRFPEREVDPERLTLGARTRGAARIHPVEETDQMARAVEDDTALPAWTPGPEATGPEAPGSTAPEPSGPGGQGPGGQGPGGQGPGRRAPGRSPPGTGAG